MPPSVFQCGVFASALFGAWLAAQQADASILVKAKEKESFYNFAGQVEQVTGQPVKFKFLKSNPKTGHLRAMVELDGERKDKGNARAAKYLRKVINKKTRIGLELVHSKRTVAFDDLTGKLDLDDLMGFMVASVDFAAGQLVHVLSEQVEVAEDETVDIEQASQKAKKDPNWYDTEFSPHVLAMGNEVSIVHRDATSRRNSRQRGSDHGEKTIQFGDYITFQYRKGEKVLAEYTFVLNDELSFCPVASKTVPEVSVTLPWCSEERTNPDHYLSEADESDESYD